MTECLNPVCPQPQNPADAKFCQSCGSSLLLNDRYQALQLIGQGGFGRTYLAVDTAGEARCVIKQLLPRSPALEMPETHGSSAATERFEQEVAQLEQLGDHPQIPHLFDHFQRSDGQYLVQEWIDGQTLAELLTAGAFSEARVRQVLNELLPVLQFIHEHQVIHRDIKPENIICAATQKLVLVDFGASKLATATALGRTGTVIGSAAYVALEQAIGRAEYASDLYSLGVTCVHLLTAVHPFDLYSVSEDAWVWRQYLSQPVSARLGRVLDKLLQRATRLRYRTAAEVLQDLNATPMRNRSPNQGIAVRPARPMLTVDRSPSALPQVASPPRQSVAAVEPWMCCHVLTGHTGTVTSIAITPDGQLLASSSDRTIKLWDLATGKLLHTFAGRSPWSAGWFADGHADRINAVTFCDSKLLVSGGEDGAIKFWDVATRTLLKTVSGHDWGVAALAVSPSGLLVSGGGDGAIRLWDLETGELKGSLTKHRDRVNALAISADGRTLVSGGNDHKIRVWNLRSNRLTNTLSGHRDRISALALSLDGQTIVSGSWDKTLRFWNVIWGDLVKTIVAHTDAINCLAVSADGQLVASGSEDSRIKIGDLVKGRRLCTLRHSWGVTALAFCPDAQMLVSGSADETMRVWQRP